MDRRQTKYLVLRAQTLVTNLSTSTRTLPPRDRTKTQESRVYTGPDVGTEPFDVPVDPTITWLTLPCPKGEQVSRTTEVPQTSGPTRRTDVGCTTVVGEVYRAVTVVLVIRSVHRNQLTHTHTMFDVTI